MKKNKLQRERLARKVELEHRQMVMSKATIRIKPLDLMTEDELLHYGRTQTLVQIGRNV